MRFDFLEACKQARKFNQEVLDALEGGSVPDSALSLDTNSTRVANLQKVIADLDETIRAEEADA